MGKTVRVLNRPCQPIGILLFHVIPTNSRKSGSQSTVITIKSGARTITWIELPIMEPVTIM